MTKASNRRKKNKKIAAALDKFHELHATRHYKKGTDLSDEFSRELVKELKHVAELEETQTKAHDAIREDDCAINALTCIEFTHIDITPPHSNSSHSISLYVE
jgi:hypothetical protein